MEKSRAYSQAEDVGHALTNGLEDKLWYNNLMKVSKVIQDISYVDFIDEESSDVLLCKFSGHLSRTDWFSEQKPLLTLQPNLNIRFSADKQFFSALSESKHACFVMSINNA